MKTVESIDQYNELVFLVKKRFLKTVTNNYLMPDVANYYIKRGMMYYDLLEEGLFLYINQNTYYVLYIIGDSNLNLDCNFMNVPILFESVHRETENADIWRKKNEDSGIFDLKCSREGFDYDPIVILNNIHKLSLEAKDNLDRDGFELISPSYEMYEKFFGFIDSIDEIPYWDVAYRSHNDFVIDSKQGLVKCIINHNKDICGAYYRYIFGNNEYGWIAVHEKYRNWAGISIVLTSDIMKGMIKRGHTGKGWIDYTNISSRRYHTHLGYRSNGRVKDVYILN